MCRYIKELADRVVRLETEGGYAARPAQGNEMAAAHYLSHHNTTIEQASPEEYTASAIADAGGRKRTYSAVSRDYNPPFPARPAYPAQELQRSVQQPSNPFSPSQTSPSQQYRDQGGLQPVTMWKKTPELTHQRSSSSHHSPPQATQNQARDDLNVVTFDGNVFEK